MCLRERHHRAHHVLDQQDGQALGAVDVAEHFDHLVALGRAQAGHHLVEQQQARARGEGARDFEALAVGQGERGGGQVRFRVEAQLSQDRAGRILGSEACFERCKRADDDVVEHVSPANGFDELESAADAGGAHLVRAQPVDALAFEHDLAAVGRVDRRR
jgi:hypothetical protein